MKTKQPNPIALVADQPISPLLQLFFECNHLKQLLRQGWLRRGIAPEQSESVAEHSFQVALMVLFLADAFPELDLQKSVLMALLHDCGEIYAGDITPHDPVTTQEKEALEQQAISALFSKIPHGDK